MGSDNFHQRRSGEGINVIHKGQINNLVEV